VIHGSVEAIIEAHLRASSSVARWRIRKPSFTIFVLPSQLSSMKIRTQLVLASFLLSVMPVSGIVTYSYYSSRRALEAAYQHEASRVAQQMVRRLGGIRHDLEQRVAALSGLQSAGGEIPDVRNVMFTMADAASLVDSVEIKPAEPPHAPVADGSESVVIDLPPAPAMPAFKLSDAQKGLIHQISQLGAQMGNAITDQQRRQLDQEIRETNAKLQATFEQNRKDSERETADVAASAGTSVAGRGAAPAPPPPPIAPVVVKRTLTPEDATAMRDRTKRVQLLFGHGFDAPIRKEGAVVGHVTAQISAEEVIERGLGAGRDEPTEVAFAGARGGNG